MGAGGDGVSTVSEAAFHVEKEAFTTPEFRGFTATASYLLEPHQQEALVEIKQGEEVVRRYLFPAYKVWNIAAHFEDIIDGYAVGDPESGYRMAAWDGISGATVLRPAPESAPEQSEEVSRGE